VFGEGLMAGEKKGFMWTYSGVFVRVVVVLNAEGVVEGSLVE
jgi:hypothetical protein